MDEKLPLPPAPSLGKILPDIFVSPSEVYQNLKNTAPSISLWLIPFLCALVLTIITSVALFTHESLKAEMQDIQAKGIQKMVEEGKYTQQQADDIETKYESMGNLIIGFAVLFAMSIASLFYFGAALFLWLANRLILKSTVGYGKHLEMYGIASWIGVFGGIITLLMMIGLGSLAGTPSGALAFLGSFDPSNKLHMLCASLNVFSLWQAAVVGIGVSKLSDKSAGTGIGIAFGLWVIWIVLSIAIGIPH